MQVTVTEKNNWEGETFGYILEVEQETLDLLSKSFEDNKFVTVEETNHTPEDVEKINAHSRNTYMKRLGYYSLPDKLPKEDLYESVFYKAVGLKRRDP